MPVYIAVSLAANSEPLNVAIQARIGQEDRYKLQANAGWLVSFKGTTIELSNHIGLTGQLAGQPPSVASAIIVPVTGYYGRGPTDMWEWLKTRLEQQ